MKQSTLGSTGTVSYTHLDGYKRQVLDDIIKNFDIADQECVPICQDTGMACVFLEIGQDVHFVGGDLTDAINEGVRRGYTNGYLRKSVVKDPVRRGNTGDNTPAMIYTEIVPGENVKVTVGPKGFGSENMSMIRMFKQMCIRDRRAGRQRRNVFHYFFPDGKRVPGIQYQKMRKADGLSPQPQCGR